MGGATWDVVLEAPERAVGRLLDVELSGSPNVRRTVLQVLEVVGSHAADWAMLALADQRSDSLTLYGGDDPRFALTLRRDPAADPLIRVIGGGRHELLAVGPGQATDDALAGLVPHDDLRAQATTLRPTEVLALPMRAREAPLGALVMVRRSGHGFDDSEVALLDRFAHRAALALDSARVHEEHAHVTRVLEENLRPPGLPVVPGVELATTFRSAAEHLEIGGDFYDVHGQDDSWLVVLGDVCGKGVDAAVLNSRARQSIRTAARYDREPGRILATLNDVLYDDASDRFVTVVCAQLRPQRDGVVAVRVAVAGHPAPLVVRADGGVEQPAVFGRLAGVIRHDDGYEEVGFDLEPGDAMVLFSDGIYEARGPRGLYGMERLRNLLSRYAGAGAVAMCEAVEQDVVEHLDGQGHDDMTALVVVPRRPSS